MFKGILKIERWPIWIFRFSIVSLKVWIRYFKIYYSYQLRNRIFCQILILGLKL